MKLHIKEETRHKEGQFGEFLSPTGPHVILINAIACVSPMQRVTSPTGLSFVRVYSSIIWRRFFPPLWMFSFCLRE